MTDPMYRQIAADLLHQIEAGELGPGEQLKTEIELREEYGASRNTIRDAIKWLITRGLVETRPGQGTFVSQRIHPFVTRMSDDPEVGDTSEIDVFVSKVKSGGRHLQVTEPRVEIQRANDSLAAHLGIPKGEPVISRHQQLSIDGVPCSLQTTFYPMEFVNQGAVELIETVGHENGDIAYLRNSIGVNQIGWRDFIKSRPPDSSEASVFGLRDDGQVPVFEVRRTGFDENGRPVRLAVTVFPADRNRFTYEAGRVPARLDPEVAKSAESEDSIPGRREDIKKLDDLE